MVKRPPTAAEKKHLARVAQLPCLVSGKQPVTVHHVTSRSDRIGRITRSHQLVVPLAPEFHFIQHNPHTSVEAIGHQKFYAIHGVDLFAEAVTLWAESEYLEGTHAA